VAVPLIMPDCPCGCELAFDRDRVDEAHAVIFHLPSIIEQPEILKRPGQRWVGMSMEGDVNYPQLRDTWSMEQFDLTMTSRLDSDIPVLYVTDLLPDDFLTPPQPKTEASPAVFIASNPYDRSGRSDYAWALMEHLPVDSHAACRRNRTFPEDHGRPTMLETIARYTFTLAFENSIAHDYLTEKFFDPLIVGSVPVYLGAPKVDDFAPADRCFINVADFAGPRELAAYLRLLDRDERHYAELLAWTRTGLRDRFRRLIEAQSTHALCRLCIKLHDAA
jgi:hypothetical protein